MKDLSFVPVEMSPDKQARLESRKLEVKNLYDQKRTKVVDTDLFWGEKIQGILPEELSRNFYLHGYVEPNLSSFLFSYLKPGFCFVDVGAHIGYFSRLAAYRVGPTGKVFSLEPMPKTFELLKKNTQDFSQIEIINAAGWNHPAELEFNDYGFIWSAYSTVYEARLPKEFLKTLPFEKVKVKALSLDDLCREKGLIPDVIKIDAESAELQVLQGMEGHVLKGHRPVVTLEVGDLDVPEATPSRKVIEWLMERNYSCYELKNCKLVRHQLLDRYEYDNLIFLPNS